jgi:hypothetical protein
MTAVSEYHALAARYERLAGQVDAGEVEDTPEIRAALLRMNFKLDRIRSALNI